MTALPHLSQERAGVVYAPVQGWAGPRACVQAAHTPQAPRIPPQVRPSTASGGTVCRCAELLDACGKSRRDVDSNGRRIRPLSNEPEVNILVQWALLMGLTNGSSRGCEPHMQAALLAQPRPFLAHMLAAMVETDGYYDQYVGAALADALWACCLTVSVLHSFAVQCPGGGGLLPLRHIRSVSYAWLAF